MKHELRSYNNIFITGMPGSGKTTFGRLYARLTQRDFIDFDDFFETTYQTKISKIFAAQGIEGFRKKETKLLQLLTSHSNKVIALGGGTLLLQDNFIKIKKNGLIAALIGLPSIELASRILKDQNAQAARKRLPFHNCQNFEQIHEKVESLWIERKNTYLASDLILYQNYNSNDNLILLLKKFEKSFTKYRQLT